MLLNEGVTYTHCSLQAFNTVFSKAIGKAEPSEEVKERVVNLIDCITYSVFVYTTRGLFEVDKLIFSTQVAFQVSPYICVLLFSSLCISRLVQGEIFPF